MVDLISDTETAEQLPQPLEMGAAGIAQIIERPRGRGGQLRIQILVIEHPQRVDLQSAL